MLLGPAYVVDYGAATDEQSGEPGPPRGGDPRRESMDMHEYCGANVAPRRRLWRDHGLGLRPAGLSTAAKLIRSISMWSLNSDHHQWFSKLGCIQLAKYNELTLRARRLHSSSQAAHPEWDVHLLSELVTHTLYTYI